MRHFANSISGVERTSPDSAAFQNCTGGSKFSEPPERRRKHDATRAARANGGRSRQRALPITFARLLRVRSIIQRPQRKRLGAIWFPDWSNAAPIGSFTRRWKFDCRERRRWIAGGVRDGNELRERRFAGLECHERVGKPCHLLPGYAGGRRETAAVVIGPVSRAPGIDSQTEPLCRDSLTL